MIDPLRRSIHPARDWASYRAIRRALRDYRPDVVHTHSAKGGLLGRLAADSLGIPAIVHTVHGAPWHPYQSALAREFFKRCEKHAARHCNALVSVADAMTDLLVNAGVAPRAKFTTIYSGMEVEPFLNADSRRDATRAALGFGAENVVIGKVARLFHLKGHADVIRAAQTIVKAYPQARFLFVGDGILRADLERQAADAGLCDVIRFAGLVPPTEVANYIGAMDVVVHASLREGLARVLPQGLIAGKPVVSYDVDGAREVVISGETGFLIPPQDVTALADALGRLIADAGLRMSLGAEGRRRFTDPFRHQEMTRRVRELYERCLATKV
jgi:glycosyltransferase involved in cell wall biosynthesis